MYYTEIDPRDGRPVYICKNPHEKAMQRALIQYRNPRNYDLVYEALTRAGRTDLIGFDKKCLIRPKSVPYNRVGAAVGAGKGTGRTKGKAEAKPTKKKTIRNVHKKK